MTEYKIQMEKFQGPLDLLIQLVDKKELEITEISLAQVTEQYIKYLETIEERFPEELADFLVVATKLLLLKSRAILPIPEQEDDPETLTQQLKMFKTYRQASKYIEERLRRSREMFTRPPVKLQSIQATFTPPQGFKIDELHAYFLDILKSLEPIIKIPRAAIQKAISMKEKMVHIQNMIAAKKSISFKELLQNTSKSRTDVIVTFIAMLELVKQRNIVVRQKNVFSDITVEKV